MKRRSLDQWFDRLTSRYLDDRFNRQSLFLSGFLVLSLTVISLAQHWQPDRLAGEFDPKKPELLLPGPDRFPGFYISARLNWRGYVTPASYLYIGLMILGISLGFPGEEAQYILLMYVMPITAAGFTIRPRATFLVAGLCWVLYSFLYLSGLSTFDSA